MKMIFNEYINEGDTVDIGIVDGNVTGEIIDITDDIIFLENSNKEQIFVSVEKIQLIKIVKYAVNEE